MLPGQYKLEIRIARLPVETPAQPVYIAGDFNDWDPANAGYKLEKKEDGSRSITLTGLEPGRHEFKFTRGSWEAVEVDQEGNEIDNHTVLLPSDSTVSFDIVAWKDSFSTLHQIHSASPNVSILDSAFFIPQLDRTRRIWLYLPTNYALLKKRFPVLYMHDGQNLFDPQTSFSGEWGIDAALDTLLPPCIVVGIDNGGIKRLSEYNVNDHPKFGKAEGRQYLEFIVKTLKPYIDSHYRTLRSRQHTLMAGSSMGGLISFYAGIYYPEVFGRLGIFSPSFHAAPDLEEEIRKTVRRKKHSRQKYFFYAGGAESKNLPGEVLNIFELMQKYAGPRLQVVIRSDGKHNESTWKKEFPVFYVWIMK